MNGKTLHEAIDTWRRAPTDENARAYYELWLCMDRAGVGDASDWFNCCQPRELWTQLDSLGLKAP